MASENEKYETLADIVAQMRGRGEDGRVDRHLWNEYADRIEAAAKRDAAIHAMTCEADERLREHLEIAIENDKRTAVGNAAAMREALVAIRDALCEHPYDHDDDALANIANAALSAPARNCDRFNTGDVKRDAQDAMLAILDEGVAGYRGIAEYLLSPVRTERKGEGNGR